MDCVWHVDRESAAENAIINWSSGITDRSKAVLLLWFILSIVSSNTFEILSDFRIIEVDRLFYDGHCLVRVDLRKRCNPPKVEHPCTRNKPQSNFIKPSEFERFMKYFDQNKDNEILSEMMGYWMELNFRC